MKHFLNNLLCILPMLTFSQVQDNFADGNFTANPAWNGTTSDFIVNTSLQLQTSSAIAATSYLSTPHNFSSLGGKEWSLYAKLGFAGSSSNFARIYLAADNANLSLNPNGYYLQLGESMTTDAVRLFKREAGTDVQICAGTAGAIASSANVGIRVVRSASGNWSLYVDYAGGTNYVLQASGTDASSLTGTHLGFLCTYTASNASKFYFDNVYAGNEILDTEPPVLLSAIAINETQVDLKFSETIQQASCETISNYVVSPANPVVSAARDAANMALVHVLLGNPLPNGVTQTITASNIADLSGNTSSQSLSFMLLQAEIPAKGDVVINEFMCDPLPVVGLPELEYVEIFNRSSKIFNLSGWKLGDNASLGTITNGWLLPGEHKILCGSSSVDSFPASVAVTSFPSLNNSGDDIVLKDNTGLLLDKLTYTDQWYRDNVKKAGGYSLELINPDDPCSDASNWKASNHALGGTPGSQNSVYDNTSDIEAPHIESVLASAPNVLTVRFNEGIDSISAANALLTTSPELTLSAVTLSGTFSPVVTYTFQQDIVSSQPYTFTVHAIADCWLNHGDASGHFALPDSAVPGDLVINEILFNPITGACDFVEVLNNSAKIIDLYELALGNLDNGAIGNMHKIPGHFMLHPGEYVAVTPDSTIQKQVYPSSVTGRFIQLALPSMNNDKGTIYLLDELLVLDEVSYSEKWHFKLLDDFDGKSLERIDPSGSSNDPKNWHTASESIGFATPGGVNSQHSATLQTGKLSLTTDTFSPDNDGYEDVLQISYRMSAPGMVATVSIYDDRGRLVRALTKSELLGMQGSFAWDGLADDNQKASIGTYILLFEAFNALNGDLFTQKKAFVLAGKL